MNSAFQALASLSSSTTAPSVTYPYQIWYDETNDILKIRSSANDAWINLFTFDQATDTWSFATLTVDGVTTISGNLVLNSAIDEKVYTITGTTAALDPSNGTIQIHTLTGNTTYTDNLTEGEAVTVMVDDGSSYTVTWPSVTWVNNEGLAPTLADTGYTVVALWKVSSTLYGALVGDGT